MATRRLAAALASIALTGGVVLGSAPAHAQSSPPARHLTHVAHAHATVHKLSAGAQPGARQAAAQLPSSQPVLGGGWSNLGPTNYDGNAAAGRALVLAKFPGATTLDSSHPLYVGTADGGIWQTTGSGWSPISDSVPNLAVGGLAADGAGHIYATTGEPDAAIDAMFGQGILVSSDGGQSWAVKNTVSGNNGNFTNLDGSAVVIDPSNSADVYAAFTYKFGDIPNHGQGVAVSTDHGATWTFPSTSALNNHDVFNMFAASNGGTTLYATVGGTGSSFSNSDPANGFYFSTNGGSTWTPLPVATPAPTNTWRWVAAIDPATVNNAPGSRTIYVATGDITRGAVSHVYKTTTGGLVSGLPNPSAWTDITGTLPSSDALSGSQQAWYDFWIGVDASSRVFVGTTDVFSFNGSDWTDVTDVYGGPGCPTTCLGSANLHPDQHAMLPVGSTAFLANDGGVFATSDLNSNGSYGQANSGLIAQQFYSGAVANSGNFIIGGLQDNANPYSTNGGGTWLDAGGGDGFVAAIDPTNANVVYVETFSSAGAAGVVGVTTTGAAGFPLSPGAFNDPSGGAEGADFVTPLTVGPDGTAYQGRENLWRTRNHGASWSLVSLGNTGGSPIRSVSVNANNAAVIWAMDDTGNVWFSTNTGASFTKTASGRSQPTNIFADPNNTSTAYITTAGFNGGHHLYKTVNGGTNWSELTTTLPDVDFRAMWIDPSNSSHFLVGTAQGVYVTQDGGTTWNQVGSGLPNASVYSVTSLGSCAYAFTHGRGAWVINLGTPPAPAAPTASPGFESAHVSWTAPSMTGGCAPLSPIQSYTVTTTGSGAPAPVTVTGTSTTVNGLTDGQTYTFTVKATNAAGSGPPSAPSNPIVPLVRFSPAAGPTPTPGSRPPAGPGPTPAPTPRPPALTSRGSPASTAPAPASSTATSTSAAPAAGAAASAPAAPVDQDVWLLRRQYHVF